MTLGQLIILTFVTFLICAIFTIFFLVKASKLFKFNKKTPIKWHEGLRSILGVIFFGFTGLASLIVFLSCI